MEITPVAFLGRDAGDKLGTVGLFFREAKVEKRRLT